MGFKVNGVEVLAPTVSDEGALSWEYKNVLLSDLAGLESVVRDAIESESLVFKITSKTTCGKGVTTRCYLDTPQHYFINEWDDGVPKVVTATFNWIPC